MITGTRTDRGVMFAGPPWNPEVEYPRCETCRGWGVIVVGYDERAKEDVERQCTACSGSGQR